MVKRLVATALVGFFGAGCSSWSGGPLQNAGIDQFGARISGIPTRPGVPNLGQEPLLPKDPATVGKRVPLTLIYTTDIHSRVEPFPTDHYQRTYAGKGGLGRMATAIKRIRESDPNTALLDSGDYLQGTPYYNFFKGEVELKLLNLMRFDAVTLGNHEFDDGVAGLRRVLPHYKGRIVSTNVTFQPEIASRYAVFKAGSLRVGVFGLMPQVDGLITPPNFLTGAYYNPITVARAAVARLRKEADIVICMSHVGTEPPYGNESAESVDLNGPAEEIEKCHDHLDLDSDNTEEAPQFTDEQIAAAAPGIDVILSGHTHLLVKNPKVIRSGGRQTHIVSSGFGGGYLGKATLEVLDGKIVEAKNDLLKLDANVPSDPAIDAALAPYKAKLDGTLQVDIAEAKGDFKRYNSAEPESSLNNLVADATLASARKANPKVAFSVVSSGTPRSNIMSGRISLEDIYYALPFDNRIDIVQVSGKVVAEMLRVKRRPNELKRHAISNATYTLAGADKIKNIMIGNAPLDLKATYLAAVNDYMAEGGSGFEMLIGVPRTPTGVIQRDALVEYLKAKGSVVPETGRILTR